MKRQHFVKKKERNIARMHFSKNIFWGFMHFNKFFSLICTNEVMMARFPFILRWVLERVELEVGPEHQRIKILPED